MIATNISGDTQATWFVNAVLDGADQTSRFISEGAYEIPDHPRWTEQARSMRPGERIALYTGSTRSTDLPFSNHGNRATVMTIHAVGTVAENPGTGRFIRVNWEPVAPPREWFFYTSFHTLWRVLPGRWIRDELIAFAFEGQPQDHARFSRDPYWRDRFGEPLKGPEAFQWTAFYQELANKLLDFRHNRSALLDILREIADRRGIFRHLRSDHYPDGTKGFLRDICPFTVFALFNRGLRDQDRANITAELKTKLKIAADIPDFFQGIPVVHNLASWFFGWENQRDPSDIEVLWDLFEASLRFADSGMPQDEEAFAAAFDRSSGRPGVTWSVTFGLFWARPWAFVSLDTKARRYITEKLGLEIGLSGPGGKCSAQEYFDLLHRLEPNFQEADFTVHSFPELALRAWQYKTVTPAEVPPVGPAPTEPDPVDDEEKDVAPEPRPAVVSYSVDNILADGCFLNSEMLKGMIGRWRAKKNLILQGPPGTGKTWLARRLAYALMGQKGEGRMRSVQFHPNLSYEDFVRGFRPGGDGRLTLVDGPFLQIVAAAKKEPAEIFVLIIEEINRGNPAQIFGELLTLLEADKRTPNEALELCHQKHEGEGLYIPSNLHVIGTMNVADRSLALVDLALRRRFAFVDLKPSLGVEWEKWVKTECQLPDLLVKHIQSVIKILNESIADDTSLGRHFQIGHSYLTPSKSMVPIADSSRWFSDVVETEIGPLLAEYWFDDRERARAACHELVKNLPA